MPGFLRNLRIDALSFWIGFLVATLLWYFLRNLRGYWPRFREYLKERSEAIKQRNSSGLEDRLRKEVLRKAQSMHLAWMLSPLDELLVEPRLLAPPPRIEPGGMLPPEEILSYAVSYLPDWPELPARSRETTVSLVEAVQTNIPIAVVGHPGSGKTVALAHLASLIARRDRQAGELADLFPALLHVADLTLPEKETDDPLNAIISVMTAMAPVYLLPQTPGFIRTAFKTGRAILLIDGIDDLTTGQLKLITPYLQQFHKEYPAVRMVVTASLDYLDGLSDLGFVPLPLAGWSDIQFSSFLKRWETLWMTVILPEVLHQDPKEAVDPVLLNYWLISESAFFSPLEMTLKTWAAYAGDSRGPRAVDAIEAYLRRLSPDPKARPALEKLAIQMAMTGQPVIDRGNAGALVAEFEPAEVVTEPSDTTLPPTSTEDRPPSQAKDAKKGPAIQRILPGLIGSGLLIEHLEDRLTFVHPVVAGYLAGRSLSTSANLPVLMAQPSWSGRSLALHYHASQEDATGALTALLQDSEEPLYHGVFAAARWLKEAPASAGWRSILMRRLAEIIQKETMPMSVRQRALAGLVISADPSIVVLFRQIIQTRSQNLRQLGALGLGLVQETKSIPDLIALLTDLTPQVRYAACLALMMLCPARAAIDALTNALSHGDEDLRRAAAESLARIPSIGHPILKKLSTSEDLLVRRAIVYGLIHIDQPWAVEILEKMTIEDGQWVVRNAASQAMEVLQHRSLRLPRILPPPYESPWLITFAGKLGTGISHGDPATDLILKALKTGNEEERIASLSYLSRLDDPAVMAAIIGALYTDIDPVRETAYEALASMAARGLPILSPSKAGIKVG